VPNWGKKRRPAASRWQPPRQRHATGASAPILAAYAAALSLTTPSLAKTPGEVHCYNGICHRVKTVEEMRLIVGNEREEITSFYDSADRDSMNVGTYTSSGEEFDADSDSHAASSLYPDGTELLVWNPANRTAAHIRVNDFGPFYMLRTIDVTRGVAEKLEFNKSGVAKLRVTVIWAPSQEEARYRRRRTYPAVEGFIGRVDPDQLLMLKHRLIATAPLRNGRPTVVAANPNSLPAFAPANGSATYAAKAAILNTPRLLLGPRGPIVTLTDRASPGTGQLARVTTLGSPQAMAAASLSSATLVTARDADLTVAVASLDTAADTALAHTFAAETDAATAPATTPAARQSAHDGASSVRAWAPNALAWQQLLVALGILSVATVGWRTRNPFANRAASASRHAAAPLVEPATIGGPAPQAPASIDNIIALPQLPRRPVTRTMDEWRAEAIERMEQFEFAHAETAYRHLLAAREQAFGSADPKTASAEGQLANCLREQGRFATAATHYRRALATMALAVGEDHPAVGDLLDEYALSLVKQGRGNDAEHIARQALTIRRAGGTLTREYAVTTSILAEALRSLGHFSAAETEYRLAWSQFIAVSGQDSIDQAASMIGIGAVLGDLGQYAAAEELLNAGTRILSSVCGAAHPATATGYAALGNLYRQAAVQAPARSMLAHALDIRERSLGERHPDTIETMLMLALIATGEGAVDEARTLLDRALDGLQAGERNYLGPQSRIRTHLAALARNYDTSMPQPLAAE
jgi:tetratricopeptide (TPR) repeat protein